MPRRVIPNDMFLDPECIEDCNPLYISSSHNRVCKSPHTNIDILVLLPTRFLSMLPVSQRRENGRIHDTWNILHWRIVGGDPEHRLRLVFHRGGNIGGMILCVWFFHRCLTYFGVRGMSRENFWTRVCLSYWVVDDELSFDSWRKGHIFPR